MRFVLLTSLLLAACTVGEVGTANNAGPDGGGGGGSNTGTGSGTNPNACVDRLATPVPATTHPANVAVVGNPSNAGENCIKAGCHLNNNLGPNAPGFQFAGTVYKRGTTQPEAGVAVRITSNGMMYSTYTDAAGNFSFPAGTLSGTFNANTNVSGCPTVTNMVGALIGGNGGGAGANSCNLCHAATGGTTAPITL